MSTASASELAPLPKAVRSAVDAFVSGTEGVEVRVWVEIDGAWSSIHPNGADESEWAQSTRIPIELHDAKRLELEVKGCPPEGCDFLAHTVQQMLAYEREAQSAARELTERYEEINLLYFISEILGSILSLPDAAQLILSEVADTLGARRASLWVFHPEGNELHLAAAVGEEGLQGPIPVDDPDSATAWVFREKEPLNIERGTTAARLPRLEPRPQGREAFLSVPINYTPPGRDARTVGVITLVGRRNNVRFNAGDARLLAAIASQIGAALETQRLVQESLKQERMVRELELAHDLQLKLLPDTTQFADLQLAARCVPAESVGGDFYQLFRLSDERIGIMIGDVSSHGFSAALIMALTISAAAIYAQQAGPPADVLRSVHEALQGELETTEMYLTLFYCVLDPRAGRVAYSNAGHPHVFRIRPEGTVERLGATDPPMGMLKLTDYNEATIDWQEGKDLLFLFTDGLSDVYDGEGTGEDNLVAEVAEHRNDELEAILDRIFKRADAAATDIPADDRSAVLIRG